MAKRLGWEVLLAVGIYETCGGAFRGEPVVCSHCGSVLEPRGDIRRLPHEVVLGFVDHAEEFLAAASLKQAGQPDRAEALRRAEELVRGSAQAASEQQQG